MYTCQSGQHPSQVGNSSQYGTRSAMVGAQNTLPHFNQARADPNQYMQARPDVSQLKNVQFTSHNGVYYNGQTSNDQALRNPQHGPTAARINTTIQTQTTNAQSHSLPNGLNCQPNPSSALGLLKGLLMERNGSSNYWPQQCPNGGIQPNVQNSLQSCASTTDQNVTIHYMPQQLDNGQNVNRMARQPQSLNSTMNTFIQDAQTPCNVTLESGIAYNQRLAQNRNHSRGYRINGTQHGSSTHIAPSSQMCSSQSFTTNNYAQMANSSVSSNQMPSHQSFTNNNYAQMANSSSGSSNQMPPPQYSTSNTNTNVRMEDSSVASSSQMPSHQSFSTNGYPQMTTSSSVPLNQMSSSQSFTSNGYPQMTTSSGAPSNRTSSSQSFARNGCTQMTTSSGASSNQMSLPHTFTSNGYTQMTNSLGAPSSQSFTSNSYEQMVNPSSSAAFLPPTSMPPQNQHSGRDNNFSSQDFIYPNINLFYSKMNDRNALKMPEKANGIVKNMCQSGTTAKSIVKENNAKCATTVQSEGYSPIKRLRLKRNGSQWTSKQRTPEASHASAPVQKGFYVTVTEDKTGFKADNVIFLGNKVDTSRFTKESVQGSSSKYAQLEQFPVKISQQRNDKQPPLQSNAKLPETLGSTVKLIEQKAVAVVQPLSQTINQVSSMQEHSQMIHGQCKKGTTKEMDGNLEKSHISPHVKDDPRLCRTISSDGTKVSLIEDTGLHIVGTDITSTKLSVSENTQHEDVESDSHCEVAPMPQCSVTTEASGENNGEMQEDSDAMDLELSLVPTIPWIFEKLMTLVETMELKCKQMQSEDSPVSDLNEEDIPVSDLSEKVLIDLCWEGRYENVKNECNSGNYPRIMAEVKEFVKHTKSDSVIVSQVDCSWDKIKDSYQVLDGDYVHPEVTYTSSWLNTNEQLDHIDKEFGFPPSLKYCPDELESDNQSKLGSDDETAEKEDSNDPFALLEIHVLPPDEAKIVFEEVNNHQAKSEMPADQSETLFSGSVVNASKADTKKPEEKVNPDIQEFCCVMKCIAVHSGKPDTKCQCEQKQKTKGLIMNIGVENGEKLAEQCTEVAEIICLSDGDDDDDVMVLSFSSAEPKSISLPSTSSMAHSCSSSIIGKETEIDTYVLTAEAEGPCVQTEKNATDRRHMPLRTEEGQTPTPICVRLRKSSDAKMRPSHSPDPNNISIMSKPTTCKRTVGLEENEIDLWEKLVEQCTDVMETADLTNYDDEMRHSLSNSEPGSVLLPSTSSIDHSCSSSTTEKGTKILSSTNEVETTTLTTNEVEATSLTSDIEDDCGQAEQNPTDMTSEVEDKCGQAEQNPTDMTSEGEDKCGQAEQNPTEKGHTSFGMEEGQTPCLSNKSSDAKVCFLKTLSLGQSHVRDLKKNLSLEGGPNKRKRNIGLDSMSTFQKKMKRCKQSSLSSKLPTFPPGKLKHGDMLSIQENNMDFEYVTNVVPVELKLFGSNNGKQMLNGRGINRENIFSDHGIEPPKSITVNLKTVVKLPVKQQIFEDPSESQATMPLQNLSVDTNTWKKSTPVVKSPVKQHIFEGPSESSPTSVKQRIHDEWEKTVVPTRGKYKKRPLTPGNYIVTCSLTEGSPKKPESVQPTNVVNRPHPVCSERRLLSPGNEKKKQSLRQDIRKSILLGSKHKKKGSPVKCNKPSDGMGSKSDKRNHAFRPKEKIVSSPVKHNKPEDGMESESEKPIILKFSILPSTFNFEDGSTGANSLDSPVKEQDKNSKPDVKGPRGDWALVPPKKYCPLASTRSAVLDTLYKETTFHQFQKKYREAKQPSGDE